MGRRIGEPYVRPALDEQLHGGVVAVYACGVDGRDATRICDEENDILRALRFGFSRRSGEQKSECKGNAAHGVGT
jgi:hypothetical protein